MAGKGPEVDMPATMPEVEVMKNEAFRMTCKRTGHRKISVMRDQSIGP
jgi:hypothetical protein